MYLNNAATTYPKPAAVTDAMVFSLTQLPSESGRGHGGNDVVSRCRHQVAEFFGVRDPKHVCFAASGTDALNTAICGSVHYGDEVVCTTFDHNSVARPLHYLESRHGVNVRRVGLENDGSLSVDRVREAFGPRTRVVILTHVSNVTGTITPLDDVAQLVASRGFTLIVDASQSAGLLPIDFSALSSRTIVTAAAHKGLYGPSGTGLLIVPDEFVEQRLYGGTGVRSEEPLHPTDLPFRHEAGTLNHTGLAGLYAGIGFVHDKGRVQLATHRDTLVHAAREKLSVIDGIELTPLINDDGRAGIVSFRVHGMSSDEVGFVLDSVFSIQVRTGLHCAPAIHRALGTFPDGLVRASFGAFNGIDDVDAFADAIAHICQTKRG